MEPENFQKENNNHTLTNILLFLVLLVMVVILFLMVKNQKKENADAINVPVEEIPKSNIIINPLTGNSLPSAEPNNELVVGQEYPLIFGSAGSTPAIYCGVKEYTSPYETPQNFMIFSRGTSCVPGEINTIGLSLTHFDVELKSEFSLEILNELNKKNGVVFAYPDRIGAWPTILLAKNTEFNAYTLAKIYYDTGYFKWTAPGAGFSINSNDADF